MPDWLIKFVNAGGMPAAVFVMWFIWQKTTTAERKADSQKWEGLIKIESEKWDKKFEQENKELDRRHEVFMAMIETQNAQTGLISNISARMERVVETQDRISDQIDENRRSFTEELRLIHSRLDKRT